MTHYPSDSAAFSDDGWGFARLIRRLLLSAIALSLAGSGCRHAKVVPEEHWLPLAGSGEVEAQSSQQLLACLPAGAPPGGRLLEVYHRIPGEILKDRAFPLDIVLVNRAAYTLNGITLSLTPGDLVLDNFSPPPRNHPGGDSLLWHLESLPAGGVSTISMTAVAGPGEALHISTEVGLTREILATRPVRSPKLTASLRLPAEPLLKELIPISLIIANEGDGTARQVTAEVQLPGGLELVQWNDVQEPSAAPPAKVFATIAPGESRNLHLAGRATEPGTYRITAVVGGQTTTPLAVAGTVTVLHPVLTLCQRGKTDACPTIPATLHVAVANTGDAPARGTMLTCELPAGIRYQSSSGGDYVAGRVAWNLGTLHPGEEREAWLETVAAGPGAFDFEMELCAVGTDPLKKTVSADYRHQPIIEITATPRPGDGTVWDVAVSNRGTITATDVELTCDFAKGVMPDGTRGATPATIAGTVASFAPIPKLPPGTRARWQLVFPKTGDIDFVVNCLAAHLAEAVKIQSR